MTIEQAKAMYEEVKKAADDHDDEHAHSCEDSLREAVLKAIADGMAEDPVALAKIALSTSELDFARWCA